MKGTADFQNAIAYTRLSEATGVVDDAAALDAAGVVLDAPFGPIVPNREEASAGAGAAPGGSAVVGDRPPAAVLASATSMRLASSVNDRVGASPSVRSVACSTTNRT
jgi:hypothetical protein